MNLNSALIKNSFYCGLSIFAVSFLFGVLKDLSTLLIFTNILPGFIYGIVLCDFENNSLDTKRFLFIVLSGGLFILVAWVATGYSFFGNNTLITFPLASVIGSTLLFGLYYLLVDKALLISKGLVSAFVIGLVSSIVPVIGEFLDKRIEDYSWKGNVSLFFTLLIFIVWQTLFGWTIISCSKHSS